MIRRISYLLFLCFCITAAIGKAQNKDALSFNAAENEAIILATLVSKDLIVDTNDIENPCSKVPCFGYIRIYGIKRKGSLFLMPENLSKNVKVHFPFGLNATDDSLFPSLKNPLPGLEINDKFEAVIQSRLALENSVSYIIYDYKKTE